MSISKQVFLSYTREDKDLAEDLARLMAHRGASVFSDMDLRPADSWADVLRKEIESASALVLLIPSEDETKRNSVLFEAGAAKALGKPILAVLPPGRKKGRLPSDIADILILDTDVRSLENVVDTLLQAIPDVNEIQAIH